MFARLLKRIVPPKRGRASGPAITRRQLASGGAALGLTALGGPATAGDGARDEMLRGLALQAAQGDAVLARRCAQTVAEMAAERPEGEALYEIYLKYARSYAHFVPYRGEDGRALDLLHAACAASRPVRFGYEDMTGQDTTRRVRPLVLVHPPQGVQLLAFCELRGAFRKFYVRSMRDVTPVPGPGFGAERAAMLAELAREERDRA